MPAQAADLTGSRQRRATAATATTAATVAPTSRVVALDARPRVRVCVGGGCNISTRSFEFEVNPHFINCISHVRRARHVGKVAPVLASEARFVSRHRPCRIHGEGAARAVVAVAA